MMPNNWEIGDFRTCKNDINDAKQNIWSIIQVEDFSLRKCLPK